MRKLLTFLLLFTILIQSTGGAFILLSFQMNRAYIAENLCVNRFDAIPVCKGQCFLNKQLNEQKKQENKAPNVKVKEVQWFCQEVLNAKFPIEFRSTLPESHFFYPLFISFEFPGVVDQPPEFA
jgi:hypothetical protein